MPGLDNLGDQYKSFCKSESLSDLTGMPPFTSLLSRISLPRISLPWTKRRDMMDPNPWTLLLDRTLKESTSITLHLYTTAAEKVADPDSLLKMLDVVWIWQLKNEWSPFHEFFVIETVDPENPNKIRSFILERVVLDSNRIEVAPQPSPDDQEPSTSYPPVSIPSPQLSLADTASLASVESAHSLSESLNKGDHLKPLDRFLGEFYVSQERYASAQCVRQLKPRGLKLFQLIILAHVVSMEGSDYTRLKNNCYWYVTTVFDAIVAYFGVDPSRTPEDVQREIRYPVALDAHGRWHGVKLTASDPKEVSVVISKFKGVYKNKCDTIVAQSQLVAAVAKFNKSIHFKVD